MIEVARATSAEDLQTCLDIRRVVFIDGQSVPEEEEVDGKDPDCLHYILRQDGMAVATARILPLGTTAKVQRVAVLGSARSAGLGAALMRHLLTDIAEHHGFTVAVLGSQTHAIGFYERLGFETFGPEYLDAGITHRDMRKSL
ncbi:MAG: GNAT family N-acetyltransferase [Pseudomonadota bacterium]